MSNKTFNVSAETVECTVPLPRRDLLMSLSPENHFSSLSLSQSPDSNSSKSNLSDREADSSPDINMLECCVSDGSTIDNLYSPTIPPANLNQTFIATPLDGSANFWNENLSLIRNHQKGPERYHTFNKNSVDGGDSMSSPDSAERESHTGSCETSRRGSTENDGCSLSSGEMVIRSNSFWLESHLVVSSLDESAVPQVVGISALPAESYLLLATLPDVYEKLSKRVRKEETGHSCLGKTFIQAEPPNEENNTSSSNSLIALPDETEGVFFMTSVCEKSPDQEKETQIPPTSAATAEAEVLMCPKQWTPGQGKTFGSTLSVTQDIDKKTQTSTPIHTTGSKKPARFSILESPCTPGILPKKCKQVSGTPLKPLVAGLRLASKVKTREIKKFPKADFSKIKSKVMTRNMNQVPGAGDASKHQLSQVNTSKPAESHRGAAARGSPAKERSQAALVSTNAKLSNDVPRPVNSGGDGHPSSTNTHTVAVKCSETEHAVSSQLADTVSEPAGNRTFCVSSSEKSSDESRKPIPKPTPKKGVSKKIEVRAGSAVGQDNPSALKSRPRCASESFSSASSPFREQRTTRRFATSLTIPRNDSRLGKTKPGTLSCSALDKEAAQSVSKNREAETSKREVKRISLVVESNKSTGASPNDGKNRFRGGEPSPRLTRCAPLLQSPAASQRAVTQSARQRQTTVGKDEFKTPKSAETAQLKLKSNPGTQRIHATGASVSGSASSAHNKPQPQRGQAPQTPTRSSLMGLPPTPGSRLPRKTLGPCRSSGEASVSSESSEGAKSTQVSGGAAQKQTPFRAAVLRARLITSSKRNTQPALATTCKPAVPPIKGAQSSTVSPLKRTVSARLRLTPSQFVDKSKPKTSSRPQQPQQQQQTPRPNQSTGPPDVVPVSVSEGAARDQSTEKLRGLLAACDRRFQAIAIVLQQTLSERDEATKHCRELSQELVNLRGELVSSVHSSERLEKEKDELRAALEDALHKLQEQHQKDLAEVEQRLQTFYQSEWDKVHLTYQEETDKCKAVMQEQMGELKANHEAVQLELESSHAQQLQGVKEQYDTSLQELRRLHDQELQALDKTLKDADAAFTGQIEALTAKNNALIEKLTAEENRRKELADKCQKDSHTLYLEQELESLKVVLDIKNEQLHQQEKKLMEVGKLKEKNVKLDEGLKKVQQENEDLKARMDRHSALSRQLSSEQAVLHENLQKESEVNKRLSMENEELLWKLHNGDLSSLRKLSPNASSPSHSFNLQSPRSSGLFSSPPVSPR